MEKTATLQSAALPKAAAATPAVAKQSEHVHVQIVHGVTMAIVMVSMISLWWEFLEFGLRGIV